MAHRYRLNKISGIVHDRKHLSERCNTDDIKFYIDGDDLEWLIQWAKAKLHHYKKCSHCMREESHVS
mgnify:FL=1